MNKNISNYIVNGYHQKTLISEQAKQAGLFFRLALILDSYHPDIDYMCFQDTLYLETLRQISKEIDYDTINISINSKSFSSIETFKKNLLALPKYDRQPPEKICFEKKGRLICFVETEFWVLCGGDYPYSDSYTISFYTETNMSENFINACLLASKETNSEIKEIFNLSLKPPKPSFFKNFF